MNRPTRTTAALLALTLTAGSLPGCAPQYGSAQEAANSACSAMGPKALSGAAIGGLGGAAAGAAIGGSTGSGRNAAIGAAAGLAAGLIGGLAVGNQLDQRDCAEARYALARMGAGRTGVVVGWQSASGSRGQFTPISAPVTGSDGRVCRQFRANTVLNGHEPVQETGTVCRDAQGDWQRV